MTGDILSAFAVIAAAEMADKTRLLTMALLSRYKMGEAAAGIALAVLTLNLFGVGVGRAVAELFPAELIRLTAGLAFLAFSLAAAAAPDGEKKSRRLTRLTGIPAIFAAFVLAELGDRTQLAIVMMSATSQNGRLGLFLGATAGMLTADAIALVAGRSISGRLSRMALSTVSAAAFALYGARMLYPSLEYYLFDMAGAAALCIATFYVIALLLLRAKGNDGGCHG